MTPRDHSVGPIQKRFYSLVLLTFVHCLYDGEKNCDDGYFEGTCIDSDTTISSDFFIY
jgi:hypothetical protein